MNRLPFKGILHLALAYGIALIAAALTIAALGQYSVLIKFAIADVVATIVVFAFSRAHDNTSVYDPYWSLAPIGICGGLWLFESGYSFDNSRFMIIWTLVLFWGVRLTWNFLKGWQGTDHEDWRYVNFRKSTGTWYWAVSFFGCQLVPTVLVFGACLPLFLQDSQSAAPMNGWDVVAVLVTVGGILLEGIADHQLWRFRQSESAKATTLRLGLWKYVRHPNYLGEVLFWWGLFLFGVAADASAWWVVIGTIGITLLFQFISIPMIDRRMLARRPDYRDWMAQTPALIPRFYR